MTLAMAVLLLVSGQRTQVPDGVKKGEKAPTFRLDFIKEDKQFDLATTIAAGKPTVLVFGSYT
jgi:hypothetical protein